MSINKLIHKISKMCDDSYEFNLDITKTFPIKRCEVCGELLDSNHMLCEYLESHKDGIINEALNNLLTPTDKEEKEGDIT